MSSSPVTRQSLALIGILSGLLLEAAAALPFLAPEVIWIGAGQALWLHLAGAVLASAAAAALVTAQRGPGQWAGTAFLLSLFALSLPGIGLLAIIMLTLILVSHHAQKRIDKISLAEVLPRRASPDKDGSLYGPGPLAQPVVSVMNERSAGDLRRIVLGIQDMPPALTRPILHKLQRHPDVRVQLYANGLLNDQLDVLERRLATLRERVATHHGDETAQTAIVEVYLYLLKNKLVASDEIAQAASQALRETGRALALNPSNPTALQARAEFQLLLHDYRDAALVIEQLRHLPGQAARASALYARLLYDFAAVQDVPSPPPSKTGHARQTSSAR